MNIKQVLSILCIAGLFAVPVVSWLKSGNGTAPEVTFTTITGKKIVLGELRGKPVLVTFWATDCPACIEEIPDLKTIYGEYHHQGLEMIAVAMFYDPPSHVAAITKARQLPYDVALDLQGLHAKAFGNVQLIPATFLISPQGKIASRTTGTLNVLQLKNNIKSLLRG